MSKLSRFIKTKMDGFEAALDDFKIMVDAMRNITKQIEAIAKGLPGGKKTKE